MSQLQKAEPRKDEDLKNFAYDLAEHCIPFNHDVLYKQFVEDLVKELCKDLERAELDQVSKHIKTFADRRKTEEKSGKIEHVLDYSTAGDGDDDDGDFNDDFDFM